MDGNRRWAKNQGLLPWIGHKKGFETIDLVIDFCLRKNISYLSLYTFSTENLQRSEEEKSYLFEVLAQQAFNRLNEFRDKNIKISFIGDRKLFPNSIKTLSEKIEKETENNNLLHLNFLFCYGGKQEIVDASRRIAEQAMQGKIELTSITQELFENNLWTTGIPSPDLIIRTGKQNRLSNFLLYQAAYSELYFLDCMWPEISAEKLEEALIYYDKCQRNFGI